jgi:hypothetical protein
MHGSCTREDGLDRTRPSRDSAAVGLGGGVGEFHPNGGREGRPARYGKVSRIRSHGPFPNCRRPIAEVTVTANGRQQLSATAENSYDPRQMGYVRLEKQTVVRFQLSARVMRHVAPCPIDRSTPGTCGHSRTARCTGSPADGQPDPLRKPTF